MFSCCRRNVWWCSVYWRCKATLTRWGLNTKWEKTKNFVSRKKGLAPLHLVQSPREVCVRGVGATLCCALSGVNGYTSAAHACKMSCMSKTMPDSHVIDLMNGSGVEHEHIFLGISSEKLNQEVETFTHRGHNFDNDSEVERALYGRKAVAWSKWRDLADLL